MKTNGDDAESVMIMLETSARVSKAIDRLPIILRLIICYRYGLGSSPPLTFKEIGYIIGCKPQNVDTLHRKSLKKLRQIYSTASL